MKRRVVLIAIGIAALIALGTINRDTCGLYDRLLDFSGCAGSVEIAAAAPLMRHTLSTPDTTGTASFFGWFWTGETAEPLMLRLDPVTGKEVGRHKLPVGDAFDTVVFARDRQRALLTCPTGKPCAESGAPAVIVSITDAAPLAEPAAADFRFNRFPGDPAPAENFSPVAVAASADRVIDVSGNDDIELRDQQGALITPLMPATERSDRTTPRLTISPTGSKVAFVDPASPESHRGDRLIVWDTVTGRLLNNIVTSPGYRTASALAWSEDETTLFAIRHLDGKTIIDKFRRTEP